MRANIRCRSPRTRLIRPKVPGGRRSTRLRRRRRADRAGRHLVGAVESVDVAATGFVVETDREGGPGLQVLAGRGVTALR